MADIQSGFWYIMMIMALHVKETSNNFFIHLFVCCFFAT